MSRPGLTLLETLVALVILSLVVVSALDLLGGTARLSADADAWARAVVIAEEGLDEALTAPMAPVRLDSMEGGFLRRLEWRPGDEPGVTRVDVTVTWTGGGRFDLTRLVALP